jgi:hypothetical protein
MARQVFLGIDASLRSMGLCVIPATWNGDFEKVQRCTLGLDAPPNATPRQLIERMIALAQDVRRFAKAHGVTDVCFEDSLTRDAYAIKALAKLTAYIEKELAQALALYACPVNQSTARKYFLGALPPKNRKAITIHAVDELTDRFNFDDEKDAFVTVNCFMAKRQGVFTYWKEPPPKAKRVAKKKASGQLRLEAWGDP